MSAFEDLGLEPNYELDPLVLEQAKNTQLASASGDAEIERVLSSFNTLKRADLRAQLMLELLGQPINLNNSIGDLSFLGQALEFREVIEESADLDELNANLLSARDWLSALEDEFARELRRADITEAAQTAQKIAFMIKLIDDIKHEIDQDDDPDSIELDPDLF
jgi:broad specificity phosphatase PhoE